MERAKRWRNLTEAQRQAKLAKDSEYEIAVQNLSADFYRKKRAGKTPDQTAYETAKKALWDQYQAWARTEGLYEEVSAEDELSGMETALAEQVEQVNALRRTLDRQEIRIS